MSRFTFALFALSLSVAFLCAAPPLLATASRMVITYQTVGSHLP